VAAYLFEVTIHLTSAYFDLARGFFKYPGLKSVYTIQHMRLGNPLKASRNMLSYVTYCCKAMGSGGRWGVDVVVGWGGADVVVG
jgi:hypothetical protein